MEPERENKKRKRSDINASSAIPTIIPFQSNSAPLKSSSVFAPDTPRLLSNFALLNVEYKGNLYPTVEHGFQAAKYSCTGKPEYASQFRTGGSVVSPQEAKRRGSKSGMKKVGAVLDITRWDEIKLDVMKALIQSKVERHKVILDILTLIRHHNIQPVHTSRTDLEWGAHLHDDKCSIKRGRNLLGDILCSVILSPHSSH